MEMMKVQLFQSTTRWVHLISVKWVHFSGKNVYTLGRKFVSEPSITSKIHQEPSPGSYASWQR